MIPIIHFEPSYTRKGRLEHVGVLVGIWHEWVLLLTPSASGKQWKLTSYLPGVSVNKEYDTLDKQTAQAVLIVDTFYSCAFLEKLDA